MDRAKALDLASKLLKMDTANGCSAEEAANAAERLSSILAEHNISMMDVQAAQMKGKMRREDATTKWKDPEPWVKELSVMLAAVMNCRVLISRTYTGPVFIFLGEETEVALCRYFFCYLCDVLPAGWRAYAKLQRAVWKMSGHESRAEYQAFNGWHHGCVQAVSIRLKDMYAKWFSHLDAADQGKARGLIVVKEHALKEFQDQLFPEVTKGRRSAPAADPWAQLAGQKHGSSIALSQGLRGDAPVTKRIG